MNEYKVEDYKCFEEAASVVTNLKSTIESIRSSISEAKSILGDESVFMGPIAEECSKGFSSVDNKLSDLLSSFDTIIQYFNQVVSSYKAGDKDASNKILLNDENGLSISTSPTIDSSNIPEITVSQVQNCKNVQEYLDLVMPVYSYYCEKYGIKYPGVLALQPVYEHSAPTGIKAQSAVQDNNLGGLKYASSIPNATPGSYPSDGTGGQYSHFNNVTEYIEAACWNIAHEGSYYQNALAQDNMADFTTSLVNTWVGHSDNYGSNIVSDYSKYDLQKFEI